MCVYVPLCVCACVRARACVPVSACAFVCPAGYKVSADGKSCVFKATYEGVLCFVVLCVRGGVCFDSPCLTAAHHHPPSLSHAQKKNKRRRRVLQGRRVRRKRDVRQHARRAHVHVRHWLYGRRVYDVHA